MNAHTTSWLTLGAVLAATTQVAAGPGPLPPGSLPQVRVAYIVPSNRTPQPEAVENLQFIVTTMRAWWCEQMDRNGFGPMAPRYETEADGVTPKVYVVTVTETDEYLRGNVWGRTISAASNAGVSVWEPGEVWFLVPECHIQFPDGSGEGGASLGASSGSGDAGGVGMIGAPMLSMLSAEGLVDDRAYDGLVIPGYGSYPLVQNVSFPWFEGPTISSVVSSKIGAAIHEVGHALGMAHDFRNDRNAEGNMMGNGLRGLRGWQYPERYLGDEMRLSYAVAMTKTVSVYFEPCDGVPVLAPAPATRGMPAPDARSWPDGVIPVPHDDATRVGLAISGAQLAGRAPRSAEVDSEPVVTITTTTPATPVDGKLVIAFEAADPDGLHAALLRRNGSTIEELALSGTSFSGAFATPYFEQATTDNFNVSVWDDLGDRGHSGNVSIEVLTTPNQAPEPRFFAIPSRRPIGEVINLAASASDDGSEQLYAWDLDGDGALDTTPVTSSGYLHTLDEIGTALISVEVTDAGGLSTRSTPIAVRTDPLPCPGDINGDGGVGFADLQMLLQAWGPCPSAGSCPADVGGNGHVGYGDLTRLLSAWGACP